PEIEIIGETDGVKSTMEMIETEHPDLVILDIHLKDGTAFDLLNSLDVIRFNFIFITAYEKYIVEALSFSAIKYFLKPVNPIELAAELNKLATTFQFEKISLKVNAFLTNIIPDFEMGKKLVLEADSGVYLITINDIIRCEGIGKKTQFHLKSDEKIIINKPFQEYEKLFENHNFAALGNLQMLNLLHFKTFDSTGANNIVTSDDVYVPYDPERKTKLLEMLHQLKK
ncbi:MAG: response regulator, partial [Bacteroidales bacterium]|nr:response regulator [Bacteroidales bacterium]